MFGYRNLGFGAFTVADAAGFSVTNSLLFDDATPDYLGLAVDTDDEWDGPDPTSVRQFTVSFWVKRAEVSDNANLILGQQGTSGGHAIYAGFQADDTFRVLSEDSGGSAIIDRVTNRVFRDTHAWYHIHFSMNSNTIGDNSCRIYVNGVEETSFSTKTNPSAASSGAKPDLTFLNKTRPFYIGRFYTSTSTTLTGYLAQLLVLDGRDLAPTNITGEFDSNGVWRPVNPLVTLKDNLTLKKTDRTAGTAIGDMTNSTAGNSLAAAFDGTFGNNDGANTATKRTNVDNAFVGKNWGSGGERIITGFSTRDVDNAGYFDNTGEGRFFLYGSNSNPSAYNDGTLLYSGATFTSAGHTTVQPLDFLDTENFDTTTAFQYHWVAMVPTSQATDVRMGELIFYENDTSNFSDVNLGKNGFYQAYDNADIPGADSRFPATTSTSSFFDGSNDYLSKSDDLTGLSTGKVFTCSFFFRITNTGTSNLRIMNSESSGGQFVIARGGSSADKKFHFRGFNSSGSEICSVNCNKIFEDSAQWHHIMCSVDLANSAAHLFVDGADDKASSPTLTNDNIDWVNGGWFIGSDENGNNKFHGDIAELYWTNEFIDLSSASNRLKFLTASGEPANLGADGSTPTGTQPLIYLANATATFQNNLGSGGNFTENGALTAGPNVIGVGGNTFTEGQ